MGQVLATLTLPTTSSGADLFSLLDVQSVAGDTALPDGCNDFAFRGFIKPLDGNSGTVKISSDETQVGGSAAVAGVDLSATDQPLRILEDTMASSLILVGSASNQKVQINGIITVPAEQLVNLV